MKDFIEDIKWEALSFVIVIPVGYTIAWYTQKHFGL